MIEKKVYAFLVANTSLTYADIANLTDAQVGALCDEFKDKNKKS